MAAWSAIREWSTIFPPLPKLHGDADFNDCRLWILGYAFIPIGHLDSREARYIVDEVVCCHCLRLKIRDCRFGIDHSGPTGFNRRGRGASLDGGLFTSRVRAPSRRRWRVPGRERSAQRRRDVDAQHEERCNVFWWYGHSL